MELPNIKIVAWILTILALISYFHVNSEIQECSIEGIDIQNCLDPTTNTPTFARDTCCVTLNQAIQVGYYCICSLLNPSDYSALTNALALSLSMCYISVPPLTHCQVMQPHPGIATPLAAMPVLNPPPLNQPLPPKVYYSDAVDTPPKLNNVTSDAAVADVKIVVNIITLLVVGFFMQRRIEGTI